MELFNSNEIISIAKECGYFNVLEWQIENFSQELIGYLGEHLKLILKVESTEGQSELNLFVKCIPRYDKQRADYIKQTTFFNKEYVMLSSLFNKFEIVVEGRRKWRPQLLFIREDLFVFENVVEMGYKMSLNVDTMTYDEVMATVETLARFHAQTFIYEEIKSKQLGKPYRIWEDFSDDLCEPLRGQNWRDAGRNAVIDYLKVYSVYKSEPNFDKKLETIVPMLFNGAIAMMNPSLKYRNVVVHRDLWSNNIFFKTQQNEKVHALIVDFQTVLYSSPMMDVSSFLYFNTTRSFRNEYLDKILDFYYEILTEELKAKDIDVNSIITKTDMLNSYNDCIIFGVTQAALIVPIIAMDSVKREQIFCNPETYMKVNEISRSDEFIEIAKDDEKYRHRVSELFDEIVDLYIR